MKNCDNCKYRTETIKKEPCMGCYGFWGHPNWTPEKPKAEPYDKKTLLLFHLINEHPNISTPEGFKSLKDCIRKVVLHGKEQYVIWYNTPDGSTHILSEGDIK